MSWPRTPWRRFTGLAAALWWAIAGVLVATDRHTGALGSSGWLPVVVVWLIPCAAFIWRTKRPALTIEAECVVLPRLFVATRVARADVVGLRVHPGDLQQVLQTVSLQVRDAAPVAIPGLDDLQDSLDFNSSVAQIADALGVGVTGQSGKFAYQPAYSPEFGYRLPPLSKLQRAVLGFYTVWWWGGLVIVLLWLNHVSWSINMAVLIACGTVWAVALLSWLVAESNLRKTRARLHRPAS
jgi:hypothetical protein